VLTPRLIRYFIPILVGFLISTAESIGDITITCRFSAVIDENDVASRIQGGLLADGVNSFIAGLLGSPPNTTFSQNCGLIPLTRCASRSAGFSACFFLIILGLFSHIGAAFASIPICVVGGVVLQAWASVFVSGMALATQDFTRRNQFILAIALGVGIGVAMETHIVDWPGPYTFFRRNLAYDYGFWPEKDVCSTPNAAWINAAGKCQGVGIFGVNNGNCCSEYDTNLKMWRTTCLMSARGARHTDACMRILMSAIAGGGERASERASERAYAHEVRALTAARPLRSVPSHVSPQDAILHWLHLGLHPQPDHPRRH
jgi:hypothetical protein